MMIGLAGVLLFSQALTPADIGSGGERMIEMGDSLRGVGDYSSALEFYRSAIPLFQSERDSNGEAGALRGIGTVHYYQGNYDSALEYWEEARQIYHEIGDRKGEGKILNNYGQVYSNLSDFDRAIGYFNQSLTLARELSDRREEGIALQNLGNVYLKRSEYPKALTNYQHSLGIFREIGARQCEMITLSTIGSAYLYLCDYAKALEYYQSSYLIAKELEDRRHEAETLNNLGIVYNYLNEYDQTISCYQQSLALCRELGDRDAEGNTLNNIGIVYSDLKNYQSALEYYTESLSIFQRSGNRIGVCSNLLNIGKVYSELGKYPEALDSINSGLEIAKTIGSDYWVQTAYQVLGDCYLAQGQVSQAQSSYSKAIVTAEGIRGKLRVESQKSSYASGVFAIYENMVTLLLEEHQDSEAFNFVERARARSFLDILGGDIQVGKSLESEFLHVGNDSVGYEPVLRSANSRKPLMLPEVQKLLDPETTLLEYFLTENKILIWAISTKNLQTAEVDMSADSLRNLVEGFRETIQWRGSTDYLSIELHKILLEPVLHKIKTDRLIIVPHGILHYLPFQALKDVDGTYLFERYQISYLPSASIMKYLPEKRNNKINRVLVLGNPAINQGERAAIAFSKSEIERIGKIFSNCEIYEDSLASESILRKLAGQCDIIHLACHADLNPSYPMYSGLMLAPGEGCDGELEVHEIFSLDLHAYLVVLSACQTGLGQLTTGDELKGLSRAFICAGARSLVCSLWAVNDESTGYFMEYFYRTLHNHNKAESLQIAERDAKEKYKDIYDWAPFVLIGAID